jgi:hypothetical protein
MQASALAVALAPLDMEAPAPIPESVTAAVLQAEAPAAPVATWSGATLPPTESTPLVAPNMPPAPFKSPLRVGLRHVVERERQVLTEQARESGKSDDVIARMIEGRIRKFYEEVVLLQQPFVMNPDQTVSAFVAETAKAAGISAEVTGFAMFKLGDGVEKKEDDFAAEVAALSGS